MTLFNETGHPPKWDYEAYCSPFLWFWMSIVEEKRDGIVIAQRVRFHRDRTKATASLVAWVKKRMRIHGS